MFCIPAMSEKEFKDFSQLIYRTCGIKLSPQKKTMLTSRLAKRLRCLQLCSFAAYYQFLSNPSNQADELEAMIDVITTNKTDFLREGNHFDFMIKQVIPWLMKNFGSGIRRNLQVWSAACSSGEEPYTLAMMINEFASSYSEFKYSILATDICRDVLQKAYYGIYPHERVEPIPSVLRKKYLMRSKDRSKNLVRIVPALRKMVTFQRLNLMDETYDVSPHFEIIYCRNVLIYFERATQEKVINHLCQHLVKGGFFFSGHSETLHGLDVPLKQVASTVYQKV